ncbi:MAG: ATP-binding protein [Alphaproteobacteria bacterium]|nr:ATP-binding protein [Alphaproteobacteria bacterium]
MCYLWRPEILWLHVGSDAVIALAYFSIPVAMTIFARRRPDLAYRPVVGLFIAFILLCGLTHLASIWTVWTPDYFLEGALKALTALASVATAIALWPLLPRALALPSRDRLEAANAQLRDENTRRAEAEDQLRKLASTLERRVTERTTELERANAALRQFSSAASHDLRAPARHMGVFAELLERDESDRLSDQGREMLGRIRLSASRMQTLIDGLLEYALLVNTPPSPETIDLTGIAERAADTHAPSIEAAGAAVTVAPLPDARADAVLIERVFDNLISNALKHAGPGPVITISGRNCADGRVEIQVTDDGPGIPADQADAAFTMLNRLSAEAEGIGAGLAFCRTIIESHGGAIWLDTSHQGGARFVFTLPASD